MKMQYLITDFLEFYMVWVMARCVIVHLCERCFWKIQILVVFCVVAIIVQRKCTCYENIFWEKMQKTSNANLWINFSRFNETRTIKS